MQGEPAESCLLLLCLPLQHRLIQPHSILIIVTCAVQSHTQYLSPAVHWSNPPHGHPCTQAIEVSAGQKVGPQQGIGGRAGGRNVDPSGSAAAALSVMIVPGRPLEKVQHFEDPLLSIGLVQEESDGQRRVA